MRARDLLRDFPVITVDESVSDAVRLLTEQDLPGLIVVDGDGSPFTVLLDTEILRLVVPYHFQDAPVLARVVDEGFPRHLGDRTLRACLPSHPRKVPICGPDATALQSAVLMMRTRSPLVAVMEGDRLLGALTLNTLLKRVPAA